MQLLNLTREGGLPWGALTVVTGDPGGVGDSEWMVSRRLATLALDPADCFKVNCTVLVTVDPVS